jgi:omega-6 fatty acid desaturase (delta-12 desaturase)
MDTSKVIRPGAVESVRGIPFTTSQTASLSRSLFQIVTSFGGLFATCAAMYVLIDHSYWLTLGLTPIAAGFVVRIFIIQHDCGHSAFFRTRRANEWVGMTCSLFTLAPYASWRRHHAGHHAVWNDLDRRTVASTSTPPV